MVKKKVAPKKKATSKHNIGVKKAPSRTQLLGPSPKYRSFHVDKDIRFLNLRVTKQTIYWSILLIFVLIMQLWIVSTQLNVIQTLDTINGIGM